MLAPNPSSKKPLWIIIAGFSVVLIANGFLVYFATSTWTGLETEQPYVKGLAYNTNLEGAKRQQALGWEIDFGVDFRKGEEVSSISRVRFSNKGGQPLTDLDVRIIVSRPTHDGYDREFALTHSGGGVYRGDFTLPLKGQWDFRILAGRGNERYQRVERIVTP